MAWSLQDSWLLGAHSNQAWPHYCVPLTIAWTWVASITASNLRSGGSPRIKIGRFVIWHHKESRKGHPVPLSFPFFMRALQFTRLSSKAIPMLYFSLPSCCLCTLAGVWDRSSSGWIEKKNNFYYNTLFIIGSMWSMSICQICNIIWEPADGAVTDSIQRLVYSPEHVFSACGEDTSLLALELFVARCWTHLFLLPKSTELEGGGHGFHME